MIAIAFLVGIFMISGIFKILNFFVNGGGEKIANGFNSFEKSLDDYAKKQKLKRKMPIDKNAPLQWKDFNDVGTRTGRLAMKVLPCIFVFIITLPLTVAFLRWSLGYLD
ncbi:hypothetical protein BKH43_05505 [Helicobacter sp. 13S00401-1]|uniref:hypothetical protein n=1 Tax=Helicobacter sp. 13S00401-1 TaxID=1905758 RepID=UPI000BA7B9BB|nr:hypothetical protein [Helicobacter sp. 13S00401-1]PAF50193.1 hypothetical protein BKH43_05505 [Helicobacter sp. 13S00401-1]